MTTVTPDGVDEVIATTARGIIRVALSMAAWATIIGIVALAVRGI